MNQQRAILWVVAADLWWGLSALYWRELASVAPIDQLGWRVSTGFVLMALYAGFRRRSAFRNLTLRHLGYGLAGAVMIFTNWAVFLWALDNDQAVDAALGYFLAPLVAVALAVRVLGERLRPFQAIALGLATVGMVWLFTGQGRVPWVAVAPGLSFGFYGLVRKQGPWGPVDGLAVEMGCSAPITIGLLLWRWSAGEAVQGDGDLRTWGLIALTGVVTSVPLILFAAAARSAPLVVVGLMQYVIPIAQFLVGWLALGESVPQGRLLGFVWIWAALAFVVTDELRVYASTRRGIPEPIAG